MILNNELGKKKRERRKEISQEDSGSSKGRKVTPEKGSGINGHATAQHNTVSSKKCTWATKPINSALQPFQSLLPTPAFPDVE